jgi:four helix bundle protein
MERTAAKTFEDLIVWQKSHAVVLEIYRATKAFPPDERYGLTSQMRRAAISIPANIAEGFVKRGRQDKARFLNIAQGSLAETRYYLILARDLGYLPDGKLHTGIAEVSRLLDAYVRAVRAPTL